jgi:hypothetical protein
MTRTLIVACAACVLCSLLVHPARGAEESWDYKKQFLPYLTDAVPKILETQDKKTGGFGKEPWICTDQNAIFPLAAAWAIEDSQNPWHHKAELLDAIMLAGDKLIAEQKPSGKWIFRKKDNSTWGDIYMPWTYTRWIRAYSLIKDAMPTDRRAKWEKALKLGMEGIAREEMKKRLANIPCMNAMGLYIAGKQFDRPDWCALATAYEHKVVDYQSPCGFWSEHSGPVVVYNQVYLDALGIYYAVSGDQYVLPALQRAAKFHSVMRYPDGTLVETVDERNYHESSIFMPNVGCTASLEGRALMKQQFELKLKANPKAPIGADMAASLILYGQTGPLAPMSADATGTKVLADHNGMTTSNGPWFAVLSAYHTAVSQSRWIQDRQNMVSLFHDRVGVILGGGNTKLQPLWSTFTVGDPSLLKHTPGDEKPNFLPPPGLFHTPVDAAIDETNTRLLLEYNLVKCQVRIDLSDAKIARVIYTTEGSPPKDPGETDPSARGPIEAHVPLLAKIGAAWSTASGKSGKLSADEPITLAAGEAGEWFEHRGCKVYLPPKATVRWPVLPHNQYAKDGKPDVNEGRIVITLPFDEDSLQQEIKVEVP